MTSEWDTTGPLNNTGCRWRISRFRFVVIVSSSRWECCKAAASYLNRTKLDHLVSRSVLNVGSLCRDLQKRNLKKKEGTQWWMKCLSAPLMPRFWQLIFLPYLSGIVQQLLVHAWLSAHKLELNPIEGRESSQRPPKGLESSDRMWKTGGKSITNTQTVSCDI